MREAQLCQEISQRQGTVALLHLLWMLASAHTDRVHAPLQFVGQGDFTVVMGLLFRHRMEALTHRSLSKPVIFMSHPCLQITFLHKR